MYKWFFEFLELLFPSRCCICHEYNKVQLCNSCYSQIKHVNGKICAICGKPEDRFFVGNLCSDCSIEKPSFDHARSVAVYEGVIKKAIHHYKFENQVRLKHVFADMLLSYFKGDISYKNIDLIIPMPLSIKRARTRGYNQSELLAEIISLKLSIPIGRNILFKIKNITPQSDLAREERLKNVKGAFYSEKIGDVNILLLDDIYTTGATAKEASKALKYSGALHIYVLTLARAVDHAG